MTYLEKSNIYIQSHRDQMENPSDSLLGWLCQSYHPDAYLSDDVTNQFNQQLREQYDSNPTLYLEDLQEDPEFDANHWDPDTFFPVIRAQTTRLRWSPQKNVGWRSRAMGLYGQKQYSKFLKQTASTHFPLSITK